MVLGKRDFLFRFRLILEFFYHSMMNQVEAEAEQQNSLAKYHQSTQYDGVIVSIIVADSLICLVASSILL